MTMLGLLSSRWARFSGPLLWSSAASSSSATASSSSSSTASSPPPPSEPEEDAIYSRVEILTSGSERAVLKSYMTFLLTAADGLGIHVGRAWKPHRIHSRKTVLKSAFVHKDHRVQYETQTHYRAYELNHVTGSTLSTFLEYTQRNLPEGVAMVVEKDRRLPFPAHIQPPNSESENSPSPVQPAHQDHRVQDEKYPAPDTSSSLAHRIDRYRYK